MIKRIIAAVGCVSVLFTCSISAVAEIGEKDTAAFLNKAGIVQIIESQTEKTVTRGEFANIAVKLIKLPDSAVYDDENAFADVAKDSKYYDAIEILRNLGIVSGTGNAIFEPDAPITVEAAAKIMVHIMGYEHYASGGDYIVAANRKKILNGVTASENGALNYENVYRIIYNTLEANVSDSNTVDGKSDGNKDDIFMSKRLDIYKEEGVVTDNGIESISSSCDVPKGKIKIGGTVYENDSEAENIIGRYVTVYYKQERNSDKKTALFISTEEDNDDILVIGSDELESYGNYVYTYCRPENPSKEKTAKISSTYKLVYNGRLYNSEKVATGFSATTEELMMPETGSVTLIDSDLNGSYDIVYVKSYKNILVEAADASDYIISGDSKVTPGSVNLKSAEDHLSVFSGHNTVGFENIRSDDVVSVAVSADGSFAEIRISSDVAEGRIEAEENEAFIIGENVYSFTKEYKAYKTANSTETALIGKNAKLYLNFEGGVVYSKRFDESGVMYARLLDLDTEKNLTARVYTSDNAVAEYVIADNVKVDGKKIGCKKFKNKKGLADYLSGVSSTSDYDYTANGEFYGVIRIKLNSENEISFIDTPYYESKTNPHSDTESASTLHVLKNGEKGPRYANWQGYSFNGDFVAERDAVYLAIGTYADEPEDDTVFTTFDDKTNVKDIRTQNGDIIAFSCEADSVTASLVMKVSENTQGDIWNNAGEHWVVVKTYRALDKKGEETVAMTVTNGKIMKDVVAENEDVFNCKCGGSRCSSNPIVVSKGDIVRFYTDSDGNIPEKGIFVAYDKSEDTLWEFWNKHAKNANAHNGTGVDLSSTIHSDYFMASYYSILKGEVFSTSGDIMQWQFDYWPFETRYDLDHDDVIADNEKIKNTPENAVKVLEMKNAYAVEVDVQKGTYTNIMVTDLIPGDRAIVLSNNSYPYLIVKYK